MDKPVSFNYSDYVQIKHELATMTRQRDAAVEDLKNCADCEVCKHGYRQTDIACADRADLKHDANGMTLCDFEWRGATEQKGVDAK